MDIDGDGVLSLYELEHFYEEMVDKMIILGIESLCVEDYMCQVSNHGDCVMSSSLHLYCSYWT